MFHRAIEIEFPRTPVKSQTEKLTDRDNGNIVEFLQVEEMMVAGNNHLGFSIDSQIQKYIVCRIGLHEIYFRPHLHVFADRHKITDDRLYLLRLKTELSIGENSNQLFDSFFGDQMDPLSAANLVDGPARRTFP